MMEKKTGTAVKKNLMFLVQGEGRGHLTQAMAVYEMLKHHKIELSCVVVGTTEQKAIPAFFINAMPCPVVSIDSPGFIKDASNKSISPFKTVVYGLFRFGRYRQSLKKIHKLIQFHQPDIVVNFYEPLAAIFQMIYPNSAKVISVAHQFIYLHPEFHFPQTSWLKKMVLKSYTKFVSLHSEQILAISMYELPENDKLHLRVVPPLLRNTIRQIKSDQKDFILVYLVNSGYQEEIIQWHKRFPEIRLHCFTDCKKVRDQYDGEWKYDETLIFHSLNDSKFMEMMAACYAVATTAGFEAVCEAMYLSKPVMMVPVRGQFEQYCNAADAQKSGAGISAENFDLSRLIQYSQSRKTQHTDYKLWVQQAENILLNSLLAG